MGARLYNNVTGHFSSTDPVSGGSTTEYVYPQDPINELALDGNPKMPKWAKTAGKFLWKHKGAIALTAAGFVPGLGATAWAYRGYKLVRGGGIYVVRTATGGKYVDHSGKVGGRLA